ncbi:MAG: leucyl aminopeptidase [Pikeienuella sp.]
MSTQPAEVDFLEAGEVDWASLEGTLVVFVAGDGTLGPAAQAVDARVGGAVSRAVAAKEFKAKAGTTRLLRYPAGVQAEAVLIACLGEAPDAAAARKTGGAIAKALPKGLVALGSEGAGDTDLLAEMIYALVARLYEFREYKAAPDEEEEAPAPRRIAVYAESPEALAAASRPYQALIEGVFFTRDLVSEPANRLTTDEFAARLEAMAPLGIDVEILGEEEMEKKGMRALLGVGQGSESASKLVVMHWRGGAAGKPPLALIGKGVVFDTGGISLKPAGGMEEMTMDMGGAGVVAGVMRTLALRGARANVVGLVGLVENMPDGRAQRPGDIVKSMKGDTIEVINTDAEGRLVLADTLWYAQTELDPAPAAMVDLATLTGAAIIALGHHNAAWYGTDEALAEGFAAACTAVGDPAWRMPLGKPYADQLKSQKADVKNVGGRTAGSITAAEFLHRFVKDGCPWIHIDIAGVATTSEGTDTAPKGATGWGVAALDRMIKDRWED